MSPVSLPKAAAEADSSREENGRESESLRKKSPSANSLYCFVPNIASAVVRLALSNCFYSDCSVTGCFGQKSRLLSLKTPFKFLAITVTLISRPALKKVKCRDS